MSSTSQVTTYADLFTDLLNRARESTSQTSRVTQAKRYINTSLHDMALGFGEKMPWLQRTAVLLTHPTYTDGTVTLFNGTKIVAGGATAWVTNNAFGQANARAGGLFRFSGSVNEYQVESVTTDFTLTLSRDNAEGETIVNSEYTYFEPEYALESDFLRPLEARSFDDDRSISLLSRTEFRRVVVRNLYFARPKAATIYDRVAEGGVSGVPVRGRTILFYPVPDTAYSIPYSYVSSHLAKTSSGAIKADLVDDTDEPLMPLRFRHIIVLGALKNWYRDQEDDRRNREVAAEYADAVRRMVSDTDIGAEPHTRIRPRDGRYQRNAARPWSGRGGRGRKYDVDESFDRLES